MEAWREELYLSHHGIEGQKWGKRNGPPYPLDYNDHSAAEKKKNPKSQLDNYGVKSSLYERQRAAKLSKVNSNRKKNYEAWDVEIDAAKKGESKYSVKQTKAMRNEEDQYYKDKINKINSKYDKKQEKFANSKYIQDRNASIDKKKAITTESHKEDLEIAKYRNEKRNNKLQSKIDSTNDKVKKAKYEAKIDKNNAKTEKQINRLIKNYEFDMAGYDMEKTYTAGQDFVRHLMYDPSTIHLNASLDASSKNKK